jgi:hypothetical protein
MLHIRFPKRQRQFWTYIWEFRRCGWECKSAGDIDRPHRFLSIPIHRDGYSPVINTGPRNGTTPSLRPLHTRDWEPMTITLQALSLVEKAEPVQVRFTLRLRDRRNKWMQDGCKVYMDSFLHGIKWIMFMVTWTIFQKPPLGGRSNIKPRDYGISNVHNRWFILFCHLWRSTWIEIYWNSDWLSAMAHMTSHYTWGSAGTTAWFWRCVGTAFGHFLLGSHNFMVVMALGSCVKWPLLC